MNSNEYDKIIADLQKIIDDKPVEPSIYIALPLSDLASMRQLPADAEVFIPPVLPASWFWEGNLLKCIRVIGKGLNLETIKAIDWHKYSCPDCLSDNTCLAPKLNHMVYFCKDCGLQWHYYMAWCPSCGGFLHGDDHSVTCGTCNQKWDTDKVKSANESNDILIEL